MALLGFYPCQSSARPSMILKFFQQKNSKKKRMSKGGMYSACPLSHSYSTATNPHTRTTYAIISPLFDHPTCPGRYHLPKPDSTCRVIAGYATQTLSPLQPHNNHNDDNSDDTAQQQSIETLEPLLGKPHHHTCNSNPIPMLLLVRRLQRLQESYHRTLVEESAFDVDEISVETAVTIAKERHEEQQDGMMWVYDEAMRIRRLMDEFGIVELDLKGVVVV
ncbi:hypothetical protein BJ741DRAFT_593403 [Chytriomyces cf. hyalinus JEL632]|nr:hypothetical protein BJ741DRAFT_593403 [Chytriomyces cf. hyalinus JEL632]